MKHSLTARGLAVLRRPPIVTVMGHVDHGKTTLLDYLRRSNVAAGEPGGITQHIGAFIVQLESKTLDGSGRKVCFLDTPGHAAFSSLRARGARVTDLVVLVIALDDGLMPQTHEVLQLVRSADLPMVIALSKADKFGDRSVAIKEALFREAQVRVEEWGGSIQAVEVSGLTGQGVDRLIEAVLAEAEMLDDGAGLLADPDRHASGWVIESGRLIGLGDTATVLLRDGSLRPGEWLVAGDAVCRARSMLSPSGRPVALAGPAEPVAVSGWRQLPPAGEEVVGGRAFSEEEAEGLADLIRADKAAGRLQEHLRSATARTALTRELLEEYRTRAASRTNRLVRAMGYDGLKSSDSPPLAANAAGDPSALPCLQIVLRADVSGSLEAVEQALSRIPQSKARIDLVSKGLGPATDWDVQLARTLSRPLLLLFNQSSPPRAIVKACEHYRLPVESHRVIYALTDAVGERLRRLLPRPEAAEVLGEAKVQQLFQIDPNSGGRPEIVAGCRVSTGVLQTGVKAKEGERFVFRVLRKGDLVHEGPVKSMRHGKKEANKIVSGMECGLVLGCADGTAYSALLPGDQIQQVRLYLTEPSLD